MWKRIILHQILLYPSSQLAVSLKDTQSELFGLFYVVFVVFLKLLFLFL